MIENIVGHYADAHGKCLPTSRCSYDDNYELCRKVLTTSFSKELLLATLKKLDVYKNAEN